MKNTITAVIMFLVLLISTKSNAQYSFASRVSDTLLAKRLYLSGLHLEKAHTKNCLSLLSTLGGTFVGSMGLSRLGEKDSKGKKKENGSEYIVMAGGALLLTGIILYLSGSAETAKAGRLLKLASGIIEL